MERSTAGAALAALAIALTVLLTGCMDASLSQSGNAPASISVQDAPSAIPEIDLSITGGGTNISETIGPGTDALVFELPVGEEHEVSIDATNFIGRRSFILPPGGAQVDVQMLEKLFVPDELNERVVQLDDVSGSNWTEDIAVGGSFGRPTDVELGPNGRIYVAASGDGVSALILDSIDDTAPTTFDNVGLGGIQAVGIDGQNGFLYTGGTGPFLERRDLSGGNATDLSGFVSEEFFDGDGIWGLAVDEEGYVYASGLNNGDPGYPTVVKLDPASGEVSWRWPRPEDVFVPFAEVDSFLDLRPGAEQIDVLYNDGRLFVANPGGKDGYFIVQLDPGTGEIVDHFGSYADDPTNPGVGEFGGPRRFIATGNRRITVADKDFFDAAFNVETRLVSFTSMNGDGWETYGTTGSGVGQFDLF